METPNKDFIDSLDSDDYDIESMRDDDRTNNFNPDDITGYLQTNVIFASINNGQFAQAEAQCSRFGYDYLTMKRIASH